MNHLVLLGLGLAWGTSFLLIKLALVDLSPVMVAGGRITIAAIILYAALRISGGRLPRNPKAWAFFAVMGLVVSSLPFFLISAGQKQVDVGVAALMVAAVPFFTLLLAHRFTDDRITLSKALGVVIGFIGIMVLVAPTVREGLTGSLSGMLMLTGAAFCFATASVLARRYTFAPPLASAAGSMICSAIIILVAVFVFEDPLILSPGATSILSVLGLAVVSTGLAHLAFFWLTARTGPNFVVANNYITPLVAMFWGVTLLDEEITWTKVIALLIIFTGVGLSTYSFNGRTQARKDG